MAPERRRQIESLYHSAMEQTPERRPQFIQDACGGDEGLRREVESLVEQANKDETDGPLLPPGDISLKPGALLGPYEIMGPLGAGGMGAVYKARDPRLNRTVAVKVSAARFSGRFKREAHAIAALNHPYICTLYDVGPNYLVMEYVEGRPLKGPLPLPDFLRYAVQIAEALAAAHRAGIVHRDLKPENILVTKAGVKLLDFGIAKMVPKAEEKTQTGVTAGGTVIGTLHYMSPEQVQGKNTDARSDIFSFGSVMLEMLTGKRAFDGDNTAAVIAAIMTGEPAGLRALQTSIPATLMRTLGRCLDKDPDDRWQTARDLQAELQWIREGGGAAGVTAARRTPQLAAGILVAALAAAVAFWLARAPQPPRLNRKLVVISRENLASPKISPDGLKVAYISSGKLYLRDLAQSDGVEVPQSDEVRRVFWSPDSKWAGFGTRTEIRKVSADGGASKIVCKTPSAVQGADWTDAWDAGGTIVFAINAGGIFRVSAEGGEAVQIMDGASTKIYDFHEIVFVNHGLDFVTWTHTQPNYAGHWIRVSRRGETRTEVAAMTDRGSSAAWSPAGFLLVADPVTGLWAFPAGPSGDVRESEKFLIDREGSSPSVGAGGTLVYLRQSGLTDQLLMVDGSGRAIQELGQPMPAVSGVVVSPDGKRVALAGHPGIWVYDLAGNTLARVVNDLTNTMLPRWSADSKLVGFINGLGGTEGGALYLQPADSSASPRTLLSDSIFDWDWSHDRDKILFSTQRQGNQRDIYVRTISTGTSEGLATTKAQESHPEIDPSGRYFAYESDETGRFEVFVRSFPGGSGRYAVSTGGGASPHWSARGDELYFLKGETLLAVNVSAKETFSVLGRPHELFTNDSGRHLKMQFYAPMPDGKRFVIPRAAGDQSVSIMLVENWLEKK